MSLLSEENCDVHLHAEIEVLKKALAEKQIQLIAMETACLHESDRQVELEDSIIAWQDKYDRLYESHKRVQKVNQNLEDKLLKLVDRNAGERAQLTSDVATLSVRLAQANYNIANLQREIERYKNDMSLAIQLLQCKPDSFVPQKISSLPVEIQTKVASYMRLDTNSHSDSEGSTSGVGVATSNSYRVLPASDSPPPICPFPPTAMVYSMRGIDAPENFNNNNNNISNNCTTTTNTNNINEISSSVMAKFLEDELKASDIKHCDTCQCSNKDLTVLIDTPKFYSIATQTLMQGETNNSLCLRCNSNLNSPSRANSPYIMKLVKSSDSVISETKSSVSGSTQNEKLFTPAKKDDLMVNPILSHHRLCDRTTKPIIPIDIIGSNSNINNILHNNNKITDVKLDDELINLIEEQIVVVQPQYQQPQQPIPTPPPPPPPPQVLVQEPHQAIITVPPTITNNINSLVDIQPADLLSNNNNTNNISCEIKHEPVIAANDEVVEYAEIKKTNNVGSGNETGAASQQCTTNGSTSSLWSKTSSNIGTEGAKMFESFNRNLIKTIKSDNPKVSGPRLCALRIQNGSNNILLDGVDPNMAPVVYTKRSRFLDEELDDTKDIITTTGRACDTHISMVMGGNGVNSNDVNIEDVGDNKTDSEKCREAHSKENSIILNGSIKTNPASTLVKNENSISVSNISINTSDKKITSVQSNNSTNNSNNKDVNKRFDRKEFETNSSCKSKNTKSGTQSSSISSDVDIQESVLLRRQQLTRVAEWVQNNSKLDNMGQISNNSSMEALSIDSGYKTKTNNNNNNMININNHNDQLLGTDKLNAITNNNNNINAQMKISNTNFINNSKINLLANNNLSNYNNIKLLSTANNEDNKTLVYNNNDNIAQNNINMKCINKQQLVQQLQQNNYHQQQQQQPLLQQQYLECNDNGNFNNIKNSIGIDIDNNNLSNDDIIGGIIINPVSNNNNCNYVVIDDKQYHQQQQQQQSQQQVQCNTNKSHVDLAQMEYNVKQFLLKQNEWSIHNKTTLSTTLTTTTTNINSSNNNNNMNTATSSPYIMGNAGIFSTATKTVITSAPIAKKHPHRTETNL